MKKVKALASLSLVEKRALLAKALAERRQKNNSGTNHHSVEVPFTHLHCLEPRADAKIRLCCFPPLAGHHTLFSYWSRSLPTDVEVYSVSLPDHSDTINQDIHSILSSFQQKLIEEVLSLADRPLAFFGESMGAMLAYSAALALAERGVTLQQLFLAAYAAPEAPDHFLSWEEYDERDILPFLVPSEAEQTRLRQEPRTLERFLSSARANGKLAKALRETLQEPKEPLYCPVLVFGGREDPFVPLPSLLEWSHRCRGAFSLQLYSGGHDVLRAHKEEVVQVLTECLRFDEQQLKMSVVKVSSGSEPETSLDFGFFFFSCNEADYQEDKYKLLFESADFAEKRGFRGLWIPERHFHPVGGLFPNPSVLASALAQRTSRLRLRAGSVVLPLHDPIRVAEEWSVVDNLSEGRVELSVVPGWNPNDYVLAPDAYDERWGRTFKHLEILHQLWRGECISRQNGQNEEVQVRIHPSPCQPHLPVWITTSSRDASFVRAGEQGAHLLTALLTQSVDDLTRRIQLYRNARRQAGYDPDTGRVALMVHTFVGASEKEVRQAVKAPFTQYMHSVQSLWKDAVDVLRLDSPKEIERVLEMVFERYFQKATLFGTAEECIRRAESFRKAGVNEIACAIDFGVPFESTMRGLQQLDRVRRYFLQSSPNARAGELHS